MTDSAVLGGVVEVVIFGGVFDYIGLQGLKRCHYFSQAARRLDFILIWVQVFM